MYRRQFDGQTKRRVVSSHFSLELRVSVFANTLFIDIDSVVADKGGKRMSV